MITVAQRTELIDDLTGSCMSLAEALATFDLTEDDLALSDHQAIDEQIFCCDDCGWWCGVEEMNDQSEALGGQYCTQCRPDEEEE